MLPQCLIRVFPLVSVLTQHKATCTSWTFMTVSKQWSGWKTWPSQTHVLHRLLSESNCLMHTEGLNKSSWQKLADWHGANPKVRGDSCPYHHLYPHTAAPLHFSGTQHDFLQAAIGTAITKSQNCRSWKWLLEIIESNPNVTKHILMLHTELLCFHFSSSKKKVVLLLLLLLLKILQSFKLTMNQPKATAC